MRLRPAAVAATLVTALLAAACGGAGASDDALVRAVAAVPAEIAGDGLLVRRGPGGSELLLDALGVEPAEVTATATGRPPAVRVVVGVDGGAVADRLAEAGFAALGDVDGWRLLERPDGADGYPGVPAVAVDGDRVAVGGVDQLRTLAAGGSPLAVDREVLAGADAALLAARVDSAGQPLVDAAALPPFEAAVLTAGEEGDAGRLALVLPDEGTQADAVALAVRVRTAGPLGSDGQPLLTASSPLTRGDVAAVDISWQVPAVAALEDGLTGGLLDFLGS